MNIVGIIPARMASTRLPGKPLALILGIPMLGHVFMRSQMCDTLNDLYVATCDQKIYDYIHMLGGKAVMTSECHDRASDRTAEAMCKIEDMTGKKIDIVVMIQGDEPMVEPEMITEAVQPLLSCNGVYVSNLMTTLKDDTEYNDPNEVKVVTDRDDFALYFSREPIPSRKKGPKAIVKLKQVCIIPFLRNFLLKFNELEPTPLEIIESIDMLRVLEHGYKVKMIYVNKTTYSVDTLSDLKRVEVLMNKDILIEKYKHRIAK